MSITDLPSLLFQLNRNAEEEAGRVYEPVIGIVTDNKDPDKLARVKVKFPTLSAQDNSWWAPLISVGAGKNRGWFFIPEVDDEVLVIFEHGDMGRPVVIGALWNGKDKPPDSNSDGSNKKRTMVSRTGDTIELDDDSGKITIKDGGGKGEIVIDKANKISYTAKMGDALIHSKDDLTIDAKEVSMEAQATLDIVSGSGDIKAGSDGKIDLKGQAMVMAKGTQADINGGSASAPSAPSSSPAEVADPVA